MTPAYPRPPASRLAVRFAVILALALLPAGVIAFVQTKALEDEVQARSEVALMGATLQAAAAETNMIGRVRGMVGALAAAVPRALSEPGACADLMARAAAVEPSASLVAFIPKSGLMTCSSRGQVYDFADSLLFQRVAAQRAPSFVVNRNGPVSGTSVLGISHPVFDATGVYLGYTVISIPHKSLNELRFAAFRGQADLENPVVFWTFGNEGVMLTSNIDLVAAERFVPAAQPMRNFVGGDSRIFEARALDGKRMTYAVVPIVKNELYIMSSFRLDSAAFPGGMGSAVYVPTFLMWLVGLIASAYAAEILVTRHVRTLNRRIVAFARGDRRLEAIELKGAPAELNELASAYLSMTESITRSEAELEDSLHQKEVLLREVHHRVKNNLQLISSIMNIQIRNARSGEAKDLLKSLQERIMSLATVHRGLYQTSGLADVRARELIPDIVRQILSMSSGPEKPFTTKNEIDDLRLVPDQAVPLSLLLAEALTNAIKHAGATRSHPGKLFVRLTRLGASDAVLEVTNSRREREVTLVPVSTPDTGIGSQLITAFVQQLGGRHEFGLVGAEYTLKVTFAISPLSTAENLHAPDAALEKDWNPSAP